MALPQSGGPVGAEKKGAFVISSNEKMNVPFPMPSILAAGFWGRARHGGNDRAA
jgi:hypothetical protein